VRFTASHDARRLGWHRYGCIDQARGELCRLSIGSASWCPFGGIFGNPNAALHYKPCYTARILKFPAKAGMK
jgi:hypothetical protein